MSRKIVWEAFWMLWRLSFAPLPGYSAPLTGHFAKCRLRMTGRRFRREYVVNANEPPRWDCGWFE
jgi:hypothetical protein